MPVWGTPESGWWVGVVGWGGADPGFVGEGTYEAYNSGETIPNPDAGTLGTNLLLDPLLQTGDVADADGVIKQQASNHRVNLRSDTGNDIEIGNVTVQVAWDNAITSGFVSMRFVIHDSPIFTSFLVDRTVQVTSGTSIVMDVSDLFPLDIPAGGLWVMYAFMQNSATHTAITFDNTDPSFVFDYNRP